MRSFISAVAIGIALICGSILYTNHIQKISDELIRCNSVVYRLISEDKFSEADQVIQMMCSYIDDKKIILAATGNHEEIDKIEINIAELMQYNNYEFKADAAARTKVLYILFEHLPKNYKLRPENIL